MILLAWFTESTLIPHSNIFSQYPHFVLSAFLRSSALASHLDTLGKWPKPSNFVQKHHGHRSQKSAKFVLHEFTKDHPVLGFLLDLPLTWQTSAPSLIRYYNLIEISTVQKAILVGFNIFSSSDVHTLIGRSWSCYEYTLVDIFINDKNY